MAILNFTCEILYKECDSHFWFEVLVYTWVHMLSTDVFT